jgi:hypothetical protein
MPLTGGLIGIGIGQGLEKYPEGPVVRNFVKNIK